MYLMRNIKQFFDATLKEILALVLGLALIFLMLRLDLPDFNTGYMLGILMLVTMVCRYNFVAEYIIKEDFIELKKNKATLKYIISKNIISLFLVVMLVFIVFLLEIIITRSSLSYEFYFSSLVLATFIIAFNNIIFMFSNKSVELRSNEFEVSTNIQLGFKDLISSLPSIFSVFIVFYFNQYVYTINIYNALMMQIMSIILLNSTLKNKYT